MKLELTGIKEAHAIVQNQNDRWLHPRLLNTAMQLEHLAIEKCTCLIMGHQT